jgi:PBP1b-binding outer membrane lipoprotein LpoB
MRSFVKTRVRKITSILIVAFFCSVFFSACAGMRGEQTEEKTATLQPLTGIVVMPTVMAEKAMGPVRKGGATLESVKGFVDGLIAADLGENNKVHIVTEGQLDALLTDAAGGRLAQMKALGAKLDSNAVLEVTVTRFHERDGSDLSVNSPASAAFEMVLTQVDTGMVLWAASFDETQEALSSNLLTLGKVKNRGFKWITVEDLVRQGLKERLADCPYLQK